MMVALDAASIPEGAVTMFEATRATMESALQGASPAANVKVKVFGQVGAPDAPPRTLTVEVTLLG
jgi:hypothetical protein